MAGIVGVTVYSLVPRPVEVEVARVSRGPLRVTVDEDGQTRIKERYIVSAPLAGRLGRIGLHPGDAVEAGKTVLATVQAADPTLLDARAVAESEARVKATSAAVDRASAELEKAQAEHRYAAGELGRVSRLYETRAATRNELDAAELKERATAENLRAARFAVQVARYELEQARAALLHGQPEANSAAGTAHPAPFSVPAPITGRVLRVMQESSAVVTPGTPLLEVGDPADLEVEVDVLSRDAVRIRPGAKVFLEEWGGGQSLAGRVRVVEPAAFTKVSALGVEEQRVWVIADFADPPAQRPSLGDRYRVDARVVVWEGQSVLKVPVGALFRRGDAWAVFCVVKGRAALRSVTVGQRNDSEAEVVEGLREGDAVVLYPSDRVADGVAVAGRG